MNLAVAATTFVLVIPAELPDKTFVSCVVMGSRHRALPVWIGAALALVLQAGLAVLAGGLLALLPHAVVRAIVAALFIGGALYLLLVPEKSEVTRGEQLAAAEDEAVPAGAPASSLRIIATTFSIIALAEFGDITQVLIANLTAHYRDPGAVFAGAAGGFVVVSAAGVLAGRTITRWVRLSLIRRLSGVALLGLGIYSLVTMASG